MIAKELCIVDLEDKWRLMQFFAVGKIRKRILSFHLKKQRLIQFTLCDSANYKLSYRENAVRITSEFEERNGASGSITNFAILT